MNLSEKKYIVPLLLFSFLFVLFSSCLKPDGKDAYLSGFKKFIERVEKHHANYNKKDWEWADRKFEQYNNIWYFECKDELSTGEELEVIIMKLKYQNMKNPTIISDVLKNLEKEDDQEIKGKINEYIENDFD
ncbi:MAG: hypothetical protein JW761_01150, partial [Prolixibacteraceae bacterium]|nr:hypothetical protein [Prolixibacteraceae bacterium]